MEKGFQNPGFVKYGTVGLITRNALSS